MMLNWNTNRPHGVRIRSTQILEKSYKKKNGGHS